MLFEEAINSWTLQISTFLDHKKVDSQFKNNEVIHDFMKRRFIRNETDVFVGYLVLSWSLLFLIYKKWLNKLLRRNYFPLIQRNRIIGTIWDCIFCVVTINYLLFNIFLSLKSSMLMKIMKFNFSLYKSFYIHKAGVNIFIFGSWLNGCSDLLFSFFVLHSHTERLNSSICLLLFMKVIDTSILSMCRFLLYCWNKQIHSLLVTTLLVFHCLTWSYIYIYFVPKYILWESNNKNSSEKIQIWMWYFSECLNSVWLKLFTGFDVYFFPPLPKESIEFANRISEQKALLKKQPNAQRRRKAEIAKTVTSVIVVKKKLRRMLRAKEAKLGLQSCIEDVKNEKDDDDDEKVSVETKALRSLLCAMAIGKEIKLVKEEVNSFDSPTVSMNDSMETDSATSEINKKIDETIDEKIDENIEEKIDGKIDEKIYEKVDEKIDETIDEKIDGKIDKKINEKIDETENDKMHETSV